MTPNATPDDSAVGWVRESNALLRGINHTLSNRVASVSALAGVFEPDEAPGVEMTNALAAEARRLDGVLRLMRLLTGTSGAAAEPILLGDLLPEVVLLHAQHADFREGEPASIVGAPDVLPVVAPSTALAHALLVLLSSARRAGARAALRYEGDERTVTLTVAPDPAASLGTDAPAAARTARWLLADVDAAVHAEADAFRLEMPTLLEVRRRRKAG